MRLQLVPQTIRSASKFVDEHHRHHKAPQGGLFAVGAEADGRLVGTAIIGRPVARSFQDGNTAEVTRVCVTEGHPNVCSMLYGSAWRAARALGYTRLITYTLVSEAGTSLRAAGWVPVHETRGGTWDRAGRRRDDKHPTERKMLWERRQEPDAVFVDEARRLSPDELTEVQKKAREAPPVTVIYNPMSPFGLPPPPPEDPVFRQLVEAQARIAPGPTRWVDPAVPDARVAGMGGRLGGRTGWMRELMESSDVRDKVREVGQEFARRLRDKLGPAIGPRLFGPTQEQINASPELEEYYRRVSTGLKKLGDAARVAYARINLIGANADLPDFRIYRWLVEQGMHPCVDCGRWNAPDPVTTRGMCWECNPYERRRYVAMPMVSETPCP